MLLGNTYSGEFHMGELHGQGIMKYRDGAVYEGTWERNRRSGYGMYKKDGGVYQGGIHNNMRHGEGTMIYSNGDRYDGDWVDDMRQGHGEFRATDGTLYDVITPASLTSSTGVNDGSLKTNNLFV